MLVMFLTGFFLPLILISLILPSKRALNLRCPKDLLPPSFFGIPSTFEVFMLINRTHLLRNNSIFYILGNDNSITFVNVSDYDSSPARVDSIDSRVEFDGVVTCASVSSNGSQVYIGTEVCAAPSLLPSFSHSRAER